MSMETVGSALHQFAKLALILTLVGCVAVAIVCWLAGWHTLAQYGAGLILAGGVAFLIGLGSMIGNERRATDWRYHSAWSTGVDDYATRMRQQRREIGEGVSFLVLMSVVTLALSGLGAVVRALFP
jgi:hypothetical protein